MPKPSRYQRLRKPVLAVFALAALALLIWKQDAMTQALYRHNHADLPRFTELPAFNPYRQTFTCRHEAQANPVPSEAAQALFEEGLVLSDWGIPRKERDFKKIASLYRQAMELGHWKAQFNLAGLYLEGDGVPFDPNEALRLTEDLMAKGVPAAWFNMGNYYMSGVGPLQADATVAYAFWQRAADMGSLHAQAELGKSLDADVNEPPKWWANRVIGREMLECAFAQGSGAAAEQLGLTYRVDADDPMDNATRQALHAKALNRYHEGVKFGSEDCANGAYALFFQGSPLVGNAKDPARSRRYFAIAEYLRHHPETRLPNLDKVLPLPPAKLPKWDGEVESLIEAAKAVRVTPSLPAQPAASAPGRARITEGHSLVMPAKLHEWAQTPIVAYQDITAPASAHTGLAIAAFEGYYQPLHIWATHPQSHPQGGITPGSHEALRMKALAAIPPLHYRAGERLDLRTAEPDARQGYAWNLPLYFASEGEQRLVYWQYKGAAQAQRLVIDHLASAGQVRAIAQATSTLCADGAACPISGIWQPEVSNLNFEGWKRQAFVQAGQNLPRLGDTLASVLNADEVQQLQVQWRLMQATELGFAV